MSSAPRAGRPRFYRVQGGRRPKRRLSTWVAVAAGVVATTWVLVFGETGWLRVRAEEQAVRELRRESAVLHADTEELEARVEEIQKPASPLLEKVARERYLMKREGEEVIHILDPAAESPKASDSR